MSVIILVISGLYAAMTIALWFTWLRIPTFGRTPHRNVGPPQPHPPLLTVVIPCRNEAANLPHLLGDLARQSCRSFEVIVADDSSTDATPDLVRDFARTAPFPLRLLTLTDERTASPKKRALTAAIAQASGILIVTTDGDCRVGPHWLDTIAHFYRQTGAVLISGPVTFLPESSRWDHLQTVEGASLIGAGAATLSVGFPTMCNGANLCYEKRVFLAVGGFAGVDQVASGDDELLMHKIARHYPGQLQFLKSREAVVRTGAHRSWQSFYQQRKRWASKWRAYESAGPAVLAVFVFLSNLASLLAPLGWLAGWWSGTIAGAVLLLKVVPEWAYLSAVLVFLQKRRSVKTIPLTQVFYSLYVVFFGLAAQRKGFVWKDRNLT